MGMRSVIAGSLESLSIVAAIVGTLLPPWNLFWWGLGFVFLRGGIEAFVLPGVMLGWPFTALSNLIREKA